MTLSIHQCVTLVKGSIVSKRAETLSLRIPSKAKATLKTMAEGRKDSNGNNVYPSDLMREALAEYLEKHGVSVSLDVDRGGNRRAS